MEEIKQLFSDESDGESGNNSNKFILKINTNYERHYLEFRKKEELQKLKDREEQLLELEDEGCESDDSVHNEVTEDFLEHYEKIKAVVISGGDISHLKFFPDQKPSQESIDKNSNNFNDASGSKQGTERKKKKKDNKQKDAAEPYTQQKYMMNRSENVDQGAEPACPAGLFSSLASLDSDDEEDGGESLLPATLRGNDDDDSGRSDSSDDDMLQHFIGSLSTVAGKDVDCQQFSSSEVESDSSDNKDVHKILKETAAQSSLDSRGHKSYPAVIDSSSRPKSSKRKDARLRRAEKKEQIVNKLREEVKELQALKAAEYSDRLKYIAQQSGQTKLAFNEADLEQDFDPEAHDRKMQEMFDHQYYDEEQDAGEDDKPCFGYDEAIDGDIVNYDKFQVAGDDVEQNSEQEYDEDNDQDTSVPDAANDGHEGADGLESSTTIKKRRRGKKKSSLLMEVLEKPKPRFDPSLHDFDSYYDEYYGLEFEDVIAGDIKCRYKYKTVEPNNFGLTTDEILGTDDRELNKWYSARVMQRVTRTKGDEEKDRELYKRRAANIKYKKKIMPSYYQTQDDSSGILNENTAQEMEIERKKSKNLKKKLRKQLKAANAIATEDGGLMEEPSIKKRRRDEVEGDNEQLSKKSKHVTKAPDVSTTPIDQEVDEERELKARNKAARKQRKLEEQRRLEFGLTPVKKASKKDEERKHRHDITVGDAYGTVLKIADPRLKAYGLDRINKLKKMAQYHESQKELQEAKLKEEREKRPVNKSYTKLSKGQKDGKKSKKYTKDSKKSKSS